MVKGTQMFSLFLACIFTLLSPIGSTLLSEDYVTEQELQCALLHSSNNVSVPNLYILANAFFPLQGTEPICVPVEYHIHCETNPICTSSECINCTDSEYVTNYLWTGYDVNSGIGIVLLSYALDGIELLGFTSWEKLCSFKSPASLYLNLSLTYSTQDVVLSSLIKLTSQVSQTNVFKCYSVRWSSFFSSRSMLQAKEY